jgi:nucleotide-binding universal stress UspA family protein
MEGAMYKHILIPTDGSDLSNNAIEHGLAFAKSIGAKVTSVTVSEPFHIVASEGLLVSDTEDQYTKDCEARADRFLGAFKRAAAEAGVPSECVHAVHDHPYQAIIDTALAKNCELICMASHGRRGIAALLLGSETTKVLTHSKIPVLVYR